MRLFGKRDMRSTLQMVAISDLRQTQWSGALQLAREGGDRDPVTYRRVHMIFEAAGESSLRGGG